MGVVFDVPGNPRPISQSYPQLDSSSEIVRAGSSDLATRTSVGGAIVPYNNTGGAISLAGAAGNVIALATQLIVYIHHLMLMSYSQEAIINH